MDIEDQRDHAEEAANARTMRDDPETKQARHLLIGDVVMNYTGIGDQEVPEKVTYVQLNNHDGDIPTSTIVFNSGRSILVDQSDPFRMGTESDVRQAEARAFRAQIADRLRTLAHMIVQCDLPLGRYPVFEVGVVDDIDALKSWADVLDASITGGGTDKDIPVMRNARLGPLEISAQAGVQWTTS